MGFDCSDERCAAETREKEKGEGGKGEEGGLGGGWAWGGCSFQALVTRVSD